ncbi:Leucine-rich repeat protein kinase family protein [Raphanus sativus]|uniref:Inactive LRR receptor-like serine/threonine-protein kinase BIR2 n=1 Tax=Raphanus sativus TaxID=3726 RepID=A0A6J0MXA1_RAPSA|nr:inactive LRR receptor-like serine/threonine-protein kinase BIR2 [Raphanus sativus]KAJ4900946.1 Leucine-rich repeat protein kinase family protein [Raphanus sativus]
MESISSKPRNLLPLLIIFLCYSPALTSDEDDIRCLRGIHTSLTDPHGFLKSWNFANTTVGFLCSFAGVSCWNNQENRVLNLELRDMSLSGQIPDSLQFCRSLQKLDLSGNRLTGSIPRRLCSWLPFLVSLDLSNNQLNGEIPPELAECRFVNSLVLSDNRLSGQIPVQLSSLGRLVTFSVSNNKLTGRIPSFFTSPSYSSDDFNGNKGLCGRPLSSSTTCDGGLSKKNLAIIIAAGVFGAAVSIVVWWYYYYYHTSSLTEEERVSSLAQRLRIHKLVQVSLFQKPLVKVKLGDLMSATNHFSSENVIVKTRTGTTYKALLPDGSALAVKHLRGCKLEEREFRHEMNRLWELLRHPNVAPLLGFCVVEDEKFLVYKYMSNGTLKRLLESGAFELDWSTRFRIGLGAARGLAWLHHGCRPPILHHNVCSSVILVDEDFDARIVDSGLARLMNNNNNESRFMTGELGEFGYVAPEYSTTMVGSLKGDVYGLGVVLLELATGVKALGGGEGFKGSLVDWVKLLESSGRMGDAFDEDIRGKGNDEEILKFVEVACHCVAPRPKERWSMFQAYRSLKALAEKQGYSFTEHDDDFPLIFDTQEN